MADNEHMEIYMYDGIGPSFSAKNHNVPHNFCDC